MNVKLMLSNQCLAAIPLLLFGVMISTTAHAADCESAKTYFRQALAIKHPPGDVKVLMEKEQLYRKATSLCPTYAEAHNNLADVYEHLGRYAEAVEAYKRAAELNKAMPLPYFGLGDVYFKSGNYPEAIQWYDKGLAIDPSDNISQDRRRQAEALRNKNVVSQEQIVKVLGRLVTRGPGDVVKVTFGEGLIPFDTAQARIREDAKAQLRELGKALSSSELSSYGFEIGGHTDIRGSEATNLELSLKRAEAVKHYLVTTFSVAPARLKVKGYGKYQTLAPGNDEASHAVNRRVEIVRLGRLEKKASMEPTTQAETRVAMDVGFLYRKGKNGARVHIQGDGTSVLRTGTDPYQIFFRPEQISYVYVLQKDATGKWYVLFPKKDSGSHKNPVQPEKDYWLPGFDQGFSLDETRGEETIHLVASLWQVPELESPASMLEERVLPITQFFKTRGVSRIGKPTTSQAPGTSADYTSAFRKIEGTGGFARSVSFIHR